MVSWMWKCLRDIRNIYIYLYPRRIRWFLFFVYSGPRIFQFTILCIVSWLAHKILYVYAVEYGGCHKSAIVQKKKKKINAIVLIQNQIEMNRGKIVQLVGADDLECETQTKKQKGK